MVQTLVGIARIVESQSTAAHMFRAVVAGFELFSADAQGVRDVGTMEVATKSGERHSAKRDELFFDEICGFQFFKLAVVCSAVGSDYVDAVCTVQVLEASLVGAGTGGEETRRRGQERIVLHL